MIFLSVTTLILGSAPPCGALDLDEVLALALERGDEVATQQAELAAAHADEALARTLRILPPPPSCSSRTEAMRAALIVLALAATGRSRSERSVARESPWGSARRFCFTPGAR